MRLALIFLTKNKKETEKMLDINVNELRAAASTLRAGDKILLSGRVYTARDAAHARMVRSLEKGESLPFEIKDAVIYYAGPTPQKNGLAIGSCGPTTSSRMDVYTPRLLDLGLLAMIGKGIRSRDVTETQIRNKALYFCAIGGAGAIAASHIKSAEVIAYPDLGCEAIRLLEFDRFPLFVGTDIYGKSIYDR
ncbi:MAG: fumarate hydratase C-terminal domain-containing protein [Clostridia bacterium]|nr:fumarate hydratase C-terminal domain-containing protein [Clostridia bacterium]